MARFLRQEHRLPHRGSFDSEDAASFGRGHESRDEFNKLMEGYLREEEEYIQVLVELTVRLIAHKRKIPSNIPT